MKANTVNLTLPEGKTCANCRRYLDCRNLYGIETVNETTTYCHRANDTSRKTPLFFEIATLRRQPEAEKPLPAESRAAEILERYTPEQMAVKLTQLERDYDAALASLDTVRKEFVVYRDNVEPRLHALDVEANSWRDQVEALSEGTALREGEFIAQIDDLLKKLAAHETTINFLHQRNQELTIANLKKDNLLQVHKQKLSQERRQREHRPKRSYEERLALLEKHHRETQG